MSESFQEFCKRILPVVQAGADGKKVQGRYNVRGSEWEQFGEDGGVFKSSGIYRIAEPKATPLPITPEMWAMIDEKYNYAFLSYTGQKVVCEKEPKWDDGKGGLPADWIVYGYCSKLPLNIDTTGITPELSLTKRPEPVKVKDYPEPPEFTVNVERLKTASEILKELDEQRERDKKSDLDECKSQSTHYMQKVGGKIYFRRFGGDWQLLHEPSLLWLSVYLVDESKLIEIK